MLLESYVREHKVGQLTHEVFGRLPVVLVSLYHSQAHVIL
jgi:hypothetical protein